MKLDLNVQIKNLDGTNAKDEKGNELILSKVIAQALYSSAPGVDPLKAFEWSQNFYKDGFVEMDQSDLNLFKSYIESSQFAVVIKGVTLQLISDCKK